jgi:hypothetical protein
VSMVPSPIRRRFVVGIRDVKCDSGDIGEQDIPKLRLLPSICCCLLVWGRILCVKFVVRFSVFPGFSSDKCLTTQVTAMLMALK